MNTEQSIIRKAGLKVTLPRILILQMLRACEEAGEHPSAEDLFKRILENGDQASLGAIYRVLAQFESAGLVARHQFLNGPSVYQLAKRNHHNHMVCQSSGEIIEFTHNALEQIEHEIATAHGFEILNSQVVLYVRKSNP